MQHLKANTQVTVTIGPFVDVGDGFTPETGSTTLSTFDMAELVKHGTTTGIDISGRTWAVLSTVVNGYYNLTLTTTDTNTEGMLLVVMQDDSVFLPVKAEYMVLSEAAYDSLYAAKDDGFMDVNIKTIGQSGTTETEADNLETACSNYSATRGLTGTAVPAVAADGAFGLPISDAGGLDMDAILADTNELQGDWVNAGRLDAILDLVATQATADAIETDTQDLQTQIGTAGAGLGDLGGMSTGMKAEVNVEALDVLNTDTFAEPAKGAPGATVSLAAKIGFLYKAWRNRSTMSSSVYSVYNDDATTVDHDSAVSDAAGTAERSEMTDGP